MHPLFSHNAQLPKAKPFNYLNPNAKIGVVPPKMMVAADGSFGSSDGKKVVTRHMINTNG